MQPGQFPHTVSRILFLSGCIYLGLGSWAAFTQAQTITSGPEKTALIELFTSQGCSSCPSAEAYLNSYKENPLLWKKYIPLALHVDYWDYLGWKDRFASAENTLRQRQYARVNSQRTIYTPGFFVNGKPWRRGFFNKNPEIKKEKAGVLKVDLQDKKLSARFFPLSKPNEQLILNVAIVGMGFSTAIEAGEREGSRTRHEFILLKHAAHKSDDLSWQMLLPDYQSMGASRLALVVWVNKENDPRPIQAAGDYLD